MPPILNTYQANYNDIKYIDFYRIEFIAMNENFKCGIPQQEYFWNQEIEIIPFIFDDINAPTENIYLILFRLVTFLQEFNSLS